MVTEAPSPKRRRTDTGALSARSIAQNNATLSHSTGQSANRWMQGVTLDAYGKDIPLKNIQTRPFPSETRSRNDHPELVHGERANPAEAYRGRPTNLAGTTGQHSTDSAAASVVNSEPPVPTAPPKRPPSETTRPRESMEPPGRPVARQGLPSPAPSDENVSSPPGSETPHLSRLSNPPNSVGNNVASTLPQQSGAADPTAIVLANGPIMQALTPRPPVIPSPAQPLDLQGGPRRPGVPDIGHNYPTRSRRPQSMTGGVTRAPGHSQTLPIGQTPVLSGVNNVYPVPVTPYNHAMPPSLPLTGPPSLLGQSRMTFIAAIDDQRQNYDNTGQKGQTFQADAGRLRLLREAVERDDDFYVVLSQLFCLRTTAPTSLPENVSKVDQHAFRVLSFLLAPNSSVHERLIRWFADFPKPIMSIYTSDWRLPYDYQVGRVIAFLERLPRHWDFVVSTSKNAHAPLLVEDMVNLLALESPVLQTTAFRAIARMFWNTGIAEDGVNTLVSVHEMDQTFYKQRGRRTVSERQRAYDAYRAIYKEWREHERRVQTLTAQYQHVPEQQRPVHTFQVPQQALAPFLLTNPHMHPGNMQMQQPQLPPTVLQQQETMVRNAAALDRSAVFPMPTADSSRLDLLNPFHQQSLATSTQQPAGQMPQFVNMTAPPLPRRPRLFPDEREIPRAQPTHPDTLRSALHQAHLRSPLLGHVEPVSDVPRLFRHVVGFACSPTRIQPDMPIQSIVFDMTQSAIELIPKTYAAQAPDDPPLRLLKEGHQSYRLRCAKSSPTGFPTESSWVTAENIWPEHIYIDLNGKPLEPRRKLYHGRYLPVDLTQHLVAGTNKLGVTVNRSRTDTSPFQYALAVEIVGVLSHETILDHLRTISAGESLAAIKKGLANNHDNGNDDDVAVMSSSLTVELFDPISSSKIFKTPVRGSSCLHKDCFDLETFLGICPRNMPGWPTVVDCWRCPICRGDVRPQTLLVDGFLADVRNSLEEKGLLETRAIVVEEDGSWKPKEVERTGVRSSSLEREDRAASTKSAAKKHVEVVELD